MTSAETRDNRGINADLGRKLAAADPVLCEVVGKLCHAGMMHDVHRQCKPVDAGRAFAVAMHHAHDKRMMMREIREAQKLSQRDLADLVSLDQSTIQRAEKMDKTAKLTTYRACAAALGVPLAALFARTMEEARLIVGFETADGAGRRYLLALAEEAKALPPPPDEPAT